MDEIVPNLLHPAQLEAIVAVLRKTAEQAKVALPEDRVLFIAQNIQSNARALERALTRLAPYRWGNSTELTRSFTQQALQNSIDTQVRAAVDRLQKSSSPHRGTKDDKVGWQDWTPSNRDFGFSLLIARQGRKATRVRQQLEVNMRESERERLARRDAHQRELEIRAKKRKC